VGFQNLTELNRLLLPFSYRVRKEDCLDLPDKVYIKREVELTKEQQKLYSDLKSHAIAFVEQKGMITASTILTQILRLQQVCSGFAKLEDGSIVTVDTQKPKELLAVLEETDGKVIIWANFTHDILSIRTAIAAEYGPETVETFYGATKGEERQDIVEKFQDPAHPLRFFVGQPRTGGYGLTLTEAKTVIYYSNGYDLEVRLQSEDRAHRIGQTNKVTYIDIITKGTIDEKILQALRNKINISSLVMAEGYKEWII
jgi:SNF2 family DNA or RNA helicase